MNVDKDQFLTYPRAPNNSEDHLSILSNAAMVKPVAHFDILSLLETANCILTYSGGNLAGGLE